MRENAFQKRKRYNGLIITRAHNVEKDFSRISYKSRKSFLRLLTALISGRREKYILKNSDKVFTITEFDKKRFQEIYRINSSKIDCLPIGVGKGKIMKFDGVVSAKIRCLITGSLYFGPNADATLWFINNVYPLVKDKIALIIAGLRPSQDIKQSCFENNIELIDSPDDITIYFNDAELFLAPIFDGSGMKVKIAEAMSYGLPIVTTSYGRIGYEMPQGASFYIADNAEEFASKISKYICMEPNERKAGLELMWNTYISKYSEEAIQQRYKSLINDALYK